MARLFRLHWIIGVVALSCLFSIVDAQAARRNLGQGSSDAGALLEGRDRTSDEAAYAGGGRYRYQYFPEAQVYYDPSRELFFYTYRGEWIKSPALPRELRSRLGDFVTVELNEDDPLRYHRESMGEQRRQEEDREESDKLKTYGESAPSSNYYQFRYYPQVQTYFDPTKNVYYYFQDGRWLKSMNPPRSLRSHTDDYVLFETDTQTPYIYHEQVLHMVSKQAKESNKLRAPKPNWEPRGNERAFRYWYYPIASVYYDPDRRIYFYSDHDQWVDAGTLPAYLAENLGTPVELTMNTPTPYQYHSRVMEVYPHPGVSSNQSRPVFRIWSGQ